ncbi:MAG: HIRAN domain-containing protein, partial [Thermodesulfovibrionales bacterium]|nr:HIRAN domain-containing protein [Thermodesulfovibrionales bacterium]
SKYIIGMPDFFVIDTSSKQLFFCEVKSRLDKIQDHQKLWFLKNIVDFPTEVQFKLLKFLPEKIFSTFDSTIAGLRYRCDIFYLSGVQVKEKLILEREPQNPYDRFAIKVIRKKDNKHIGYIPRTDNREIWQYLNDYELHDCYVKEIKRLFGSGKNTHKIEIKIVFEIKTIKT